jgi:hypothetical protein
MNDIEKTAMKLAIDLADTQRKQVEVDATSALGFASIASAIDDLASMVRLISEARGVPSTTTAVVILAGILSALAPPQVQSFLSALYTKWATAGTLNLDDPAAVAKATKEVEAAISDLLKHGLVKDAKEPV